MEVIAEKIEIRYTFKEVEKNLYKQALKIINKFPNKYEVDELVNEVWLMGNIQKVKDIRYVSRRAFFDMIDYIRKIEGRPIGSNGVVNKYHKRELTNQDGIIIFFNNIENKGRTYIDEVNDKDEVNFVLSHIPEKYKDFLIKYYFKHMTLKEIGKTEGRCENTMSTKRKKALEFIREEEIITTDKRLTNSQKNQKNPFDSRWKYDSNRKNKIKEPINVLPEYVSDFEIGNESALEEEFMLEKDWE